MKLFTPAFTACSAAMREPSTFTARNSAPAFVSGTSATLWWTTSMPCIARATPLTSRMSQRTNSISAGRERSSHTSSTRTRSPRWFRRRAMRLPKNPEPPVMRCFMSEFQKVCPFSAHQRNERLMPSSSAMVGR